MRTTASGVEVPCSGEPDETLPCLSTMTRAEHALVRQAVVTRTARRLQLEQGGRSTIKPQVDESQITAAEWQAELVSLRTRLVGRPDVPWEGGSQIRVRRPEARATVAARLAVTRDIARAAREALDPDSLPCPTCDAQAGEACATDLPKGRTGWHRERLRAVDALVSIEKCACGVEYARTPDYQSPWCVYCNAVPKAERPTPGVYEKAMAKRAAKAQAAHARRDGSNPEAAVATANAYAGIKHGDSDAAESVTREESGTIHAAARVARRYHAAIGGLRVSDDNLARMQITGEDLNTAVVILRAVRESGAPFKLSSGRDACLLFPGWTAPPRAS